MKQYFLFIVFLLLSFEDIRADDLNFYDINDIYGVSIRETTSICKDTDGFIWIAARTGIIRLTNSDCRVYSLPYKSAAVVSVEVTWQQEQLFAFTNQGEIFRYNPRSDKFERYIDFPTQVNIANLWLSDLEVDQDGGLWLASSIGLYYFKDNQCSKIGQIAASVGDMTRYDDNHLIAASIEGIYLIDTERKQVELWSEDIGVAPASLLLDPAMNRLWIGTLSSGLYYFDYAAKKLHVAPVENFPQQCVKTIKLVSDSTIWCGIDGRGVWVLSRDGSRTSHIYQEEPDNPLSIGGNGVYDIYYESPGRVWVCSITGGASVAELGLPMITQIQHRINNPNSLVSNYIHDLIEDSRGQLWAGTNRGLSCWNPHTDKWTHYFEKKASEAFIVLALCEDDDGNIWVGTYAHGVYVIDGKRPAILAHHTRPTGILAKTGFVFDILKDANGNMWIAGMNGEILMYERRTREFKTYPAEPVYAMDEWGDRTLILACNYGLLTLDKETKERTVLLTDNMIQDIAVVQDKIWAGSNGGGLLSYNIRTHETEKYDTRHGIISNYVNSILYADGYLWLGTDNGLCRFNTIDKTITAYPFPMIISGASYTSDACFWLHNGMSAWGTSNGIIMLDPKSLSQQKATGRIYIQDLLLSGRSIREYPDLLPDIPLDSISDITLNHSQNNVTLNILPLGNYSSTARFSWKMQGFDDDWSDPTDRSVINYTNLNPGVYLLSIRLYNHDLISERILTIRITPPFWATWWFRLGCILFAGWLLYFLLRFYINRLNQQHAEDKLRFFTTTAHDLRTALTLIKAPIEELNQSGSISEHDRQHLHLAVKQIQQLTSVATQLMNFQKTDMGKEQFRPVMSDVVTLVGNRVSMFESIAASKHINIAYDYDADSYLTAIDIGMMERVIDNLLSNAVKYSHEQSVVEVHFKSNENEWRLSVIDYGIGISHKAQGKLFHEFYRGENAINAKIVGSGIGLAMSKILINLHGGKISVKSEENMGSTFEIIVPRRKKQVHKDADKQASILQDDPAGDNGTGEMRILIVEDNNELRNFMTRSLGKHFRVATATDGVEAWEYIRQEIPDLIVSDILMPRMDGLELCRLVKSTFDTSHIPIILLTALSEKTDELHGLGLGADDYMTKPFDMETLTQRIISIIRNRRITGKRFISAGSFTEAKGKDGEAVNVLNDAFVKQSLEVVMRHLDDTSFGKEEFAREMGISTSLLFKKMKALTGMSVVDFIRSVRMEHAMKLINEKRYSVSEIADRCGFSSIGYFSTVFKKHFGKSPTDFTS
ncbi:signal transduction histidine kinase/DNA-binding response OmpR family regulator/ligand-binding sensor domain-containing protein [Parabacteroides sp. PF5-5]|uniref:hybrid sensor histidine kinase/response regulator transcription factor n=1 Tax=unclassified Parabacteroides TaxID=2649774 RepID=UPI002475D54E|nr:MULTISPECIES: hybrid sensor histidine kinase/response regulator transcription factor [unclassified Parabacteroides]MDH6305299.1 signal transduction histidine kinase/DNA-binding response OmpR family regulator/ligand-binding sensor domain-containing protein [Parabacteroides sp. PH5-39]MDH6316652.1 signal transduction histidine kinase/DNA-binding response OmpR family regulator/ligand-binding sensor domain-containing protein [Parabacteroides sp. PF5-13]MDH6320168.1 signal transduction histidine k